MSNLPLRVACRYLYGGLIKPPPKMLEVAQDWVESQIISDLLWDLQEESDRDVYGYNKPEEYRKREQYLRSMMPTPGVRPKNFTEARKQFKLDLSGWEYLQRVMSHQGALKRIQDGLPSYTLVLTKRAKLHRTYADGYWSTKNKVLTVRYKDRDVGPMAIMDYLAHGLERLFTEVGRILRHEFVHLTQTLLVYAFGQEGAKQFIEDRKDLGQTPGMPGLPSSSITTPAFLQELSRLSQKDRRKYKELLDKIADRGVALDKIHTLDDVEFYSRLSDQVDEFNAKHRDLRDPERRKDVFKNWVGAETPKGRMFSLLYAPQVSDVFATWKRHAPEKWKKAVKEMAKAVL